MTQASKTIRHVSVADAADLDKLLNSAIESLIPDALALAHGIVMTRIGPGEYTVETTPDVPCGYTRSEFGRSW